MKTKRNASLTSPVPRAGRPVMPGYGVSESAKGMLAWEWARLRLEKAHNYYLATTRPNSAPHLMPVWGLWLDQAFYFSTGDKSVKARNLAANSRCALSTERADEAVIVEGSATQLPANKIPQDFFAGYKKKYGWEMQGEPVYRLQPAVAFAFIESSADFAATATRWTFASE